MKITLTAVWYHFPTTKVPDDLTTSRHPFVNKIYHYNMGHIFNTHHNKQLKLSLFLLFV